MSEENTQSEAVAVPVTKPQKKIVLTNEAGEAVTFGVGMDYPPREFRRAEEPFEVDAEFAEMAVRMHPEFFAEFLEIADVPVTRTNLQKLKVEELQAEAVRLGIADYADLKKAELVEKIWSALYPETSGTGGDPDPNKNFGEQPGE